MEDNKKLLKDASPEEIENLNKKIDEVNIKLKKLYGENATLLKISKDIIN
jgi:tetrahydromethanopterin S-methyltransferase subunit G